MKIDPENAKIELLDCLGYFELDYSDKPLSEKITWYSPDTLNLPLNTRFNLNLDDPSKSKYSEFEFLGIKDLIDWGEEDRAWANLKAKKS